MHVNVNQSYLKSKAAGYAQRFVPDIIEIEIDSRPEIFDIWDIKGSFMGENVSPVKEVIF